MGGVPISTDLIKKVFQLIGAMLVAVLLYIQIFSDDGALSHAARSVEKPLATYYRVFSYNVNKGVSKPLGKDNLFSITTSGYSTYKVKNKGGI